MKRILSILLLFLMLIAGMQPTLAIHFCGEKLQSVQISNEQKAESCCGMNHQNAADIHEKFLPKGCCSSHEVQLSTDDYQYQQALQCNTFLPVVAECLQPAFLFYTSRVVFSEKLRPDYPPEGLTHLKVDILTTISVLII